jgi:hypothetical protein
MSITRDAIEAAMSKLPPESHRLLLWLCTGQTPALEQKGQR